MKLDPSAYRILVQGEEVASGRVQQGHLLAMDPSGRAKPIDGIATSEPVFGLPAKWIPITARQDAEMLGYTVIEPVSVMVTHLTEVLRRHAHEILTRDDVKHLLENAKKKSPAVVEELIPGVLTLGEVQKVVRNLLRERIPIKNLPLILETLADIAPQTKDIDRLTEGCGSRSAARSASGSRGCRDDRWDHPRSRGRESPRRDPQQYEHRGHGQRDAIFAQGGRLDAGRDRRRAAQRARARNLGEGAAAQVRARCPLSSGAAHPGPLLQRSAIGPVDRIGGGREGGR